MDVAGNELDRQTHPPGFVPGFVVGHHPGHVTVDIHDRPRAYLTVDDAYRLALLLMQHVDLARLPGAAA
jgi:hypothetical protein